MMADRPIRTLQVVEASYAGVGRHTIDLSVELQRRGHPTTIAYSRFRMDPRFEAGLERLREIGGEAIEVGMGRDIGRSDWASLRTLRKLIRGGGPFDLVHGHSGKAGLLVRLARVRRFPMVYTPHAYITMSADLDPRRRRLYALAERLLGRRALTINVSEDERQHALRLGLQEQRLAVVYNGIEEPPANDRASLRARYGLSEENVVYGFVGRLDAQKNPLLLIEAFSKADVPQARLAIVGEGPLRPAIEARAAELGVRERILLLGRLDGLAHMAMFDVFVLSSDYEGFPYVLIEAAVSRLPIVSTHVGGVGEIVDGENGRLVPTRDVPALAAALREVGADADLRQSMAAVSAGRAGRFGLHKMVDETLKVYRQVLARN